MRRSTGKKPIVAPYSGAMLASVARSGTVRAEAGARVRVRVRARDVMIATTPLTGVSALNALQGRIAEIRESEGAEALVDIDCGGDIIVARVTRLSVRALGLAPGLPVQAVVKSVTFDRTGGAWSMER